jgi:radical SAM/Cys-rich protein
MNDFARAIRDVDPQALHAVRIDTLMLNIGLRCNMSCTHCHQSCSPTRGEMMAREDIDTVIGIARTVRPALVDITGGAPELHPDLPYLIGQLAESDLTTQVRTNLTALLEPEADGLVDLLASKQVRILASLPGTSDEQIAPQRGAAYAKSLDALTQLAEKGYGRGGDLRLDIAFNPTGTELVECGEIEAEFRQTLERDAGITFDELVVITNVPVGRFADALQRVGRLGAYRQDLRDAFNPDTVSELACRYTLDIAWDGTFSDCDFNLGAGMGVADGTPSHISDFDVAALSQRPIRFAEHCFACTAQAGSG